MNPKRTTQQTRGSIGAAAFDLYVNRELGWIFRPVHQEDDFGIDGYVDIVQDGQVTGKGIAVQIKCGSSYVGKKTPGGIRYDGEIKHLNYYMNLAQPVVLIVLDETGNNGTWAHFELEKTLPTDSEERWWMEIPITNELNASVAQRWTEIAGPVADRMTEFEVEWSRDRFHSTATHLIVALEKESVVACDDESLFLWQSKLLKTRKMMLEKRASIEFWFPGWQNDSRELYEIPEVRSYFAKTLENGFPWIYWLDPSGEFGCTYDGCGRVRSA
ncbi:hypothetical protein Poly51_58970 [Rubripirellula tenax]|uniref:DUF4365 domain-containing protein n=1 Tax=Rubripirellula tenax TaxID=2528015 RepID=A0A5C6E706_9BACT|nr:DUF4365 and DUF1817 domain-containing protein [Rubripirellula tenax]TWU44628.1 hypothetical protein Poly51_58970 [Rubripirellula tenax]